MSRKNIKKISIIVFCCKDDILYAKICIASIRFFYPEIEIFLVKDELKGKFSTKILSNYFKVKNLNFNKTKKYGWGTAKILALLSKKLKNKYYLILDTDTILTGLVLERFLKFFDKADFIISQEYHNKPGGKSFSLLYYPLTWAKKLLPNFKYPGYAFNTGALVFRPNVIDSVDLEPFFNLKRYPYWNKNLMINYYLKISLY